MPTRREDDREQRDLIIRLDEKVVALTTEIRAMREGSTRAVAALRDEMVREIQALKDEELKPLKADMRSQQQFKWTWIGVTLVLQIVGLPIAIKLIF